MPLTWFEQRLQQNAIFGGWRDPATLVGIAGLAVSSTAKLRHKGGLWGMYVRPDGRGTGLAAALLARVIQEAANTLERIQLTVTATNPAAVRLYTQAGFKQYGREQRALKIGDRYYDILLMARLLTVRDRIVCSPTTSIDR